MENCAISWVYERVYDLLFDMVGEGVADLKGENSRGFVLMDG